MSKEKLNNYCLWLNVISSTILVYFNNSAEVVGLMASFGILPKINNILFTVQSRTFMKSVSTYLRKSSANVLVVWSYLFQTFQGPVNQERCDCIQLSLELNDWSVHTSCTNSWNNILTMQNARVIIWAVPVQLEKGETSYKPLITPEEMDSLHVMLHTNKRTGRIQMLTSNVLHALH